MSMQEHVLETNKTTAATGTSYEMTTTPFVPGSNALAYINTDEAYAGKADIEGSDDGSSFSVLFTSGTVVAATGPHTFQGVIEVKKYMRFKWTRTAGIIEKASLISAV